MDGLLIHFLYFPFLFLILIRNVLTLTFPTKYSKHVDNLWLMWTLSLRTYHPMSQWPQLLYLNHPTEKKEKDREIDQQQQQQ